MVILELACMVALWLVLRIALFSFRGAELVQSCYAILLEL